jgi:hypothetical protein
MLSLCRYRKGNAVIMVTENLLQNILDPDTRGKRNGKEKDKVNYCPNSGAVSGGENEEETSVRRAE